MYIHHDDNMADHIDGHEHKASVATDGTLVQGEHDDRNHAAGHAKRLNSMTAAERARRNVNAKLANPLAGHTHDELKEMAAAYVKKYQIGGANDLRAFELGAILAQDLEKFEPVEGMTAEEIATGNKEFTHRWAQPSLMYWVIALCSVCAAVQGMGKLQPVLVPDVQTKKNPQTRPSSMAVSFSTGLNSASQAKTPGLHGCWDWSIRPRTSAVLSSDVG